ncbi:Adenosine deaminase-like protein A [Schistosoma japonicum]|nr:Adenosine deaminase-like protein A [Schistosoma japonicum]
MNSFYYDLPKVELHAHLSGSISTEFLKRESIAHHGLQYTDPRFGFESWEGDLDRCFDYFQKIHKYIDTPEILQRAGNLCDFVPLLNTARSYGFKTTVHIAEVTNQSEDWCKFLNLYLPDRLGHGTFLTDLDENAVLARGIVLNSKIPLELCLTSNVKSKTVENYKSHHINYWMEKKHPICICVSRLFSLPFY